MLVTRHPDEPANCEARLGYVLDGPLLQRMVRRLLLFGGAQLLQGFGQPIGGHPLGLPWIRYRRSGGAHFVFFPSSHAACLISSIALLISSNA